MKIIYLAHPISGSIEENLANIRRIVRKINLTMPDIVPFVPYYVDIVSLDDTVPEERDRGIANDTAILRSGIVQELWLTGHKVSYSMYQEVHIAEALGIPVINKIGLL